MLLACTLGARFSMLISMRSETAAAEDLGKLIYDDPVRRVNNFEYKYEDGKVTKAARLTVFFNGVLVQDDSDLIGPTVHHMLATYPANLPDKGPLQLQDHANPIRFRNIWVRELPAEKPPVTSAPPGDHYYERMQGH